jgi:hypothetical protein
LILPVIWKEIYSRVATGILERTRKTAVLRRRDANCAECADSVDGHPVSTTALFSGIAATVYGAVGLVALFTTLDNLVATEALRTVLDPGNFVTSFVAELDTGLDSRLWIVRSLLVGQNASVLVVYVAASIVPASGEACGSSAGGSRG